MRSLYVLGCMRAAGRAGGTHICRLCQRRLFASGSSSKSPFPPESGAAKLTPSRRLIAMHGRDAPKFLHGATTNTVHHPSASDATAEGSYSAFLNAQGRILYDVFIYPTTHSSTFADLSLSRKADRSDPGFLIECDADSVGSLMEHIDRYKLRSKFSVRLVDEGEWDAWTIWDDKTSNNLTSIDAEKGEIGCLDTRAPWMGKRVILPNRNTPASFFGDAGEEEEEEEEEGDISLSTSSLLDAYKIRRMLRGVAEGQSELVAGSALPLESNMDFMGGVDFRKGCYVGQELTIRTRHTGVVRKRVLPVQLYPIDQTIREGEEAEAPQYIGDVEGVILPPPQTNISRVGKKARNCGKFYGGIGNIGLALCRMEVMTDASLHGGEEGGFRKEDEFKIEWDGDGGDSTKAVKIKAFIPPWHRERS